MEKASKSSLKIIIWLGAAGVVVLLLLSAPYLVARLEHWLSSAEPVLEVTQEKIEPNRLVVAKLRLDVPIVFVDKASEEVFQEALQNGVVHYPETAKIGELGNPFIFGHSSDYFWREGDYKTVFATLPEIEKGDLVIASDEEGTVFRYQVIETLVVSPDQTEYLSQYNYERKLLTLQTSYPVGTALRRFIVIAELIEK